ncbi:MAG: dihydroorotase [Nitrospirae bacterium]|nr:dihydroorotase [Nitrospirota bacterium]
MGLVIQGGRLIDPKNKIDQVMNLVIEGDRVAQVSSKPVDLKGREVIDAKGMIISPGFIDLHVHLRDPGQEYKEDIRSGTESAAAGGFTSVCCMPNTRPVNDNETVTQYILEKAKREGFVHVLPVGAITKGSQGQELAEIGKLKEAGCVALSDDGWPVMNSEMMRRALEYAKAFDLVVMPHCEDKHLSEGGVMNEGRSSTEMGLRGIPCQAEEIMIARDILLADLTKSRVHFAHISSEGGVRLIREAKARGIPVTAETCPHYFSLTDEATIGYNTNAKMNPPLRGLKDREAVKSGLRDGTIDAISTDHAPHSPEEKEQEFDKAPFGIIGLETVLPLSLALEREGVISLQQMIGLLTYQPANILKIKKGSLEEGAFADITLFDPLAEWVLDSGQLKSKSRNTPFNGWKMNGQVRYTIVSGKVVYRS